MNKDYLKQLKMPVRQKIILIVLGLSLSLILLEVGLRIGGFILSSLQENRNISSIRDRGQYTIMCLGESTTAFGGKDSYPYQLEEILNERNIGIKFSVINLGLTGTISKIIVSLLEMNLSKYNPDMVITMMGVNDGASYLPFKSNNTSKITLFFSSFKTYKLARLLWLSIATKAEMSGTYESKDNRAVREDFKSYRTNPEKLRDFAQLESSLKKPIELEPKNDAAYIKLGLCYQNQGKMSQAEASFKKAIEISPGNYIAHFLIGDFYLRERMLVESEEPFKKAIELNPKGYKGYLRLGLSYQRQGKFSQAEELYKKAIEFYPGHQDSYFYLGLLYQRQGKLTEAEASFKKAIDLNPFSDKGYGYLVSINMDMQRYELAEECSEIANKLRLKYYSPLTFSSYRKLKEILDEKGIRLVCAQYPMRSLEQLKVIFSGEGGITFVDNEKIFKKAIRQSSIREYFLDMFAGDFGHCTRKGNRLLAENIANTIVKELFKIDPR